MRGKVARQLRKIADFHPATKRTYQEIVITKKLMNIYQLDGVTGQSKLVKRPVDRMLTECTDPSRKIYNSLKDQFNGKTEGTEFNRFASKETLDGITKEIQRTEDRVQATTSGNVSDESGIPDGSEN